jgi:hypothetical protein
MGGAPEDTEGQEPPIADVEAASPPKYTITSMTGQLLEPNDRADSSIIFNPPDADGKCEIKIEFNLGPIDHSKLIRPSARPQILYDFYPLIGQITTAWGTFEEPMDTLITWLIRETNSDIETRIDRLNFRKRKELCRKLIKIYFSPSPYIMSYLLKVLDDAADLQWRRNLLVHGHITYEADFMFTDPPTTTMRLRVTGRHNGKEVVETYSIDDLEAIYYKSLHLIGRMQFVHGVNIENPLLSLPDKLILLNFALKNLQSPPTPPTP